MSSLPPEPRVTADISDTLMSSGEPLSSADNRRLVTLGVMICGLVLAYALPLIEWVGMAVGSTMYSLVVLIPFISAYLIRERRAELVGPYVTSWFPGVTFLFVGGGLLVWHGIGSQAAVALPPHDRLAIVLGSMLAFVAAGCYLVVGATVVRRAAFPLLFLIFILPLPTRVEHGLEVFFQYTSAEATALLFSVTGTPYFRDGLVFQLPGITLEVAQECSGINSSYVLFITSLIAGHLFLKEPWKRVVLTLFVVPLAIVRNGFRILTIALLCVHVDPDMIHSWIHKRGGPVFFALSLVPFFLLLLWLRGKRKEVSGKRQAVSEG